MRGDGQMAVCAAVIGAGRMGSVVAARLPRDTRKIIYDKDGHKAEQLAAQIDGKWAKSLEEASQAELILIVLPAPAVNEVIERILETVKEGTIILNMATAAHLEPGLRQKRQHVYIYDAKIIGHAASISRGEPGIIVINCYDSERFALLKEQLAGFYKVEQGDSDLVERINTLSSTEGIKAAVSLRQELRNLQAPEEWINVAIRTVCAGTMKSFAEDDLGHFARELVKQLEGS